MKNLHRFLIGFVLTATLLFSLSFGINPALAGSLDAGKKAYDLDQPNTTVSPGDKELRRQTSGGGSTYLDRGNQVRNKAESLADETKDNAQSLGQTIKDKLNLDEILPGSNK